MNITIVPTHQPFPGIAETVLNRKKSKEIMESLFHGVFDYRRDDYGTLGYIILELCAILHGRQLQQP